jgi:hypothetical protein
MAEVDQVPQQFQPGPRLIDGSQLNSWLQLLSLGSADALVPSTTQTRAGGTAIRYSLTRVAAANASDAVTLGGANNVVPAGAVFVIANKSGQTIQVFPPGANDKIDGGSVGAAVNLSTAFIGVYVVTANIGGVLTIASGRMAVSS